MTKEEALVAIKAVRERINNQCCDDHEHPWVNDVCFHLDAASDVIEFPRIEPVKFNKNCEHEWVESQADTDPMEGITDVICKHCKMCGQRNDRDGSVFWPAT